MYSKNPLAINSKFLNSVLNFLIYISCYSVIDGFYIIKFLLESLKELSVFVVGKDSFVTVLQKVCAFIDSVTSSPAD